ncbi:hypothetical protein [uncultured Ruminococcus sp.]|uniref:hypothetical protein n=1 Tax=uncultured Ruminococcus sp. TaxID=165186 RepID=UPI0025E52EB1|nr:hypothetical protein [uncultured Ruminococcus sp.]
MTERECVLKWVLTLTGTFCGFADIVVCGCYIGYNVYWGSNVRWGAVLLFMLMMLSSAVLGIVQIKRLRRRENMLLPVAFFLLTAFALFAAVGVGRELFLFLSQRGFYGLSNAR